MDFFAAAVIVRTAIIINHYPINICGTKKAIGLRDGFRVS
jgi:hypothetical protein